MSYGLGWYGDITTHVEESAEAAIMPGALGILLSCKGDDEWLSNSSNRAKRVVPIILYGVFGDQIGTRYSPVTYEKCYTSLLSPLSYTMCLSSL